MLLSCRDVDMLRLVYWCQYLRPKELYTVFSKGEVSELLRLGLLKLHQNSGSIVMAGKGNLLLRELYDDRLPVVSQPYHAEAIERRLRLSRLALTAYRAGLDLFTCSTEDLREDKALFLTTHGRNRGKNPWGSTRIAAVAHLGDLAYGFHYLYPGIGPLTLFDELTAFNNCADTIPNTRRAIIFAGNSYTEIVEELDREEHPEKGAKTVSYKGAYHSLHLPLHLLSCDDVGALQLQIMAVPDYRTKLSQAALRSRYKAPPMDAPEWDAMLDGRPFILAADMNLRRIDAGIDRAKERGYSSVGLFALEEQAQQILFTRYRQDCFVGIYCLTADTLDSFAGRPMVPYLSPTTQYLTGKGGVVDAALIQSLRKTGR